MREAGKSLQYIANELNMNSIPAKKGGKWFPQTVKGVLEFERGV